MADDPEPFAVDQVNEFARVVGINAGDTFESLHAPRILRIRHIHKLHRFGGQLYVGRRRGTAFGSNRDSKRRAARGRLKLSSGRFLERIATD